MNKEDNFDPFDIMAGELSSSYGVTPEEEEAIAKAKEKAEDKDEPELDEEIKTEEPEVEEEVEEEPKETTKKVKKEEVESESLDEYEEDVAKYVSSKLENKLGVSLGEFSKVDEIVDELARLVEESSADVFASEEVADLNEYVKNGGDLKKFYKEVFAGGVDVDSVDIESVSDQKKILRENLKNSGYSEAQIERKISRYEDSGVLQEEAEDALETVKEYRSKNKEKLLKEQEKEAVELKKRNEKFIDDVQKTIKDIKEIRGIPISDKEKKEIFQFAFIPESDGRTKFQKIYSSNPRYLIESVFFTMKGDTLIQRAQNQGASSKAKELKDKLSQKGNRMKKSGTQGEDTDALSAFSGYLRKF